MPADFAASGGDIVVMTHERANGDHLVVALRSFRGRRFVDIRVFYIDRATKERRPGKGITLQLEEVAITSDALARVWKIIDGTGLERILEGSAKR